ncbi:MAG: hypothetical protein ACTHKM_04695, partial [Tsuneonella sp.]
MSVRMALAKLSATAAGTALLAGGAVHMAETQAANTTNIKSTKPVKYIKHKPVAHRHIPKKVHRQRRIVRRVVECQPAAPGAPYVPAAPAGAGAGYGAEECPPAYQIAMAPVPVPVPPPAVPFSGGGGGVTVVGGSGGLGGFGGGFFGGFFGGGGSSGGNVVVTSTSTGSTSTSGGSTSTSTGGSSTST